MSDNGERPKSVYERFTPAEHERLRQVLDESLDPETGKKYTWRKAIKIGVEEIKRRKSGKDRNFGQG